MNTVPDPTPARRTASDGKPRSMLVTEISLATWILIAACTALTVVGMLEAAPDGEGDTLWGVAMLASPVVVGAYATLELCWQRPPRGLRRAWFFRCLAVPLIAATLSAIAAGITYALPSFQAVVGAASRDGWHYWFPADAGNPLLLVWSAGAGLGMCAGLVAFVFFVLPFLAVTSAKELAAENLLDTDPRWAARNRVAMLALSVVLMAVFAAPTFFVLGWVVAGWVTIAIAVAALVTVLLTQRVDRKARIAAGAPAGLELARRRRA